MKTLTIHLEDEEYERLSRIAGVLLHSPEEFLYLEGIDTLVTGIESGGIAPNITCRVWDTIEEAKAAAVRSDEVEETAYWWAILRTPSGRWLLECGETWKREAEEHGYVLEECGMSVDWKGVPA